MSGAPWWKRCKPNEQANLILLQIDIGRHSEWVSQNYYALSPIFELRKAFATRLSAALRRYRFDLVFWAGDGGLFARPIESVSSTLEKIVENAADCVFIVFTDWKSHIKFPLDIRACATAATAVHVDPSPANWLSTELNAFLKYERHISLTNAFVITEDLKLRVSGHRFEKSYEVPIPNLAGEANSRLKIFVDSKHPFHANESDRSFRAWLAAQCQSGSLPRCIQSPEGLMEVWGCTLLNASFNETGYRTIIPEVQSAPPAVGSIDEQDREGWEARRKELVAAKKYGVSASAIRFIGEISDDVLTRLRYRVIDYVEGKAFYDRVVQDTELLKRYRPRVLGIRRTGTEVLNALSTAVIVIVNDRVGGTPHVLLAYRADRDYDGSSWAVTIGEQFKPQHVLEGKTSEADESIESSAIRGVKEELLGRDYRTPFPIRVIALALEAESTDPFFIAIADLRPLTYPEVSERWPKARDEEEHHALAAIPLEATWLIQAMSSDRLPKELWDNAKNKNLVTMSGGSQIPDDKHLWQPNSQMRLAVTLWYAHVCASTSPVA